MKFNRSNKQELAKREVNPFTLLHSELDDLFGNFLSGWNIQPVNGLKKIDTFNPNIDIDETEKEYLITAELPGVDEKDVKLTLSNDVLTIEGEKKEEHKEDKKNRHYYECSYGSFKRSVSLPDGVDTSKADASYKKGILKIKLPKAPEAQNTRTLQINKED